MQCNYYVFHPCSASFPPALSLPVGLGRSSSSPQAESDAGCSEEAALRTCLSRLLVVHCGSSSQLLLTLHYLETSLSSRPGLSLLLIDSISAFYWLDRCGGGESAARQEDKLTKCSELLSRLLRCVCVFYGFIFPFNSEWLQMSM